MCARMSRPGKTASRCAKNAGSIAIMSSKRPWIGQSFTIRIRPSRSRIVRLDLADLPVDSTLYVPLPSRIACARLAHADAGTASRSRAASRAAAASSGTTSAAAGPTTAA